MGQAFQRLERVLRLEAEQGYMNRAVVGGIRQFAAFWVGQAREETIDEADQFFVEQVAQTLSDYARLPGPEARASTVDNLLRKLAARSERAARAPQPAATTPASAAERPAPRKVPPPPAPAPPPPPPPAAPPLAAHDDAPEADDLPDEAPPGAGGGDPARLREPITNLRGVGSRYGQLLDRLGVRTVADLLALYPRRYDDYSLMKPIQRLEYGETVTVLGTLWDVRSRRARSNQVVVHAVLGDGTGKVQLNFYGQAWLVNQLKAGMQIAVSGKVEQYLGRPIFNNPEWEAVSEEQLRTNRIMPVYPLTKGLTANRLRQIVRSTLETYGGHIADPLPEAIRTRNQLLHLSYAVREIHMPRTQERLRKAQERLSFDELFLLQMGMLHQRRNWQQQPARPLVVDPAERIRFFNALPFEPTNAQRRAIDEIAADMQRDVPMNRLLQGDVGAGKTLVAAAALLIAVRAGAQAALMAPTEILAEQHYKGLSKLLAPLGLALRLLTGSTPAAEKERIYSEAADGRADIVIGTTALIQPAVSFRALDLVVIDEQHRFGVDQRGALRDKGRNSAGTNPHLLVMTATPIPRTLALSLYGDLDVSVLDEMPPGRQEILTRWLQPGERERALSFIRRQAQEGRQAYIIYPLVEQSQAEQLDEVKAAVDEFERLQRDVFPDLRLGLLHGRLSSAEKEAAMRAFYDGTTNVLVSTTVVEVGVDVPNATVIVIEAANRFGLAQLHQLRGRVGRGEHKSYCILISDSNSADATERLKALEDTDDGFQLAEKDLELRGPGEFFGRRQSGLPELRLASLVDRRLMELARSEALDLFARDPDLARPEHSVLRDRVLQFWERAGDVS